MSQHDSSSPPQATGSAPGAGVEWIPVGDYEDIRLDYSDGIAKVTICRPKPVAFKAKRRPEFERFPRRP